MSTKSPETPNFSQMVEQNLLTMKKRTSQIKGEYNDNLTEIIAKNFEQFYQLASQLVAQIDLRDKKLVEVEKSLADIYQGHPEIKIAMDKSNGKGKMKSVSPNVKQQGK